MTVTFTPAGLRIAALLALMVALASFALIQVRADGGTITACVNNNSGEIKIVDSPDDCKGNSSPLEWSSGGGGGGPVDVCDLELRIKAVFSPFALDPACAPPPLDPPTITEVDGTKVTFPGDDFSFYAMMVHGEVDVEPGSAVPGLFVDIYYGTADEPCTFAIGGAVTNADGEFSAGDDEDGLLFLFLEDEGLTWPLHFGAKVFDPFAPGFTECSDPFGPVAEPEPGPFPGGDP